MTRATMEGVNLNVVVLSDPQLTASVSTRMGIDTQLRGERGIRACGPIGAGHSSRSE